MSKQSNPNEITSSSDNSEGSFVDDVEREEEHSKGCLMCETCTLLGVAACVCHCYGLYYCCCEEVKVNKEKNTRMGFCLEDAKSCLNFFECGMDIADTFSNSGSAFIDCCAAVTECCVEIAPAILLCLCAPLIVLCDDDD